MDLPTPQPEPRERNVKLIDDGGHRGPPVRAYGEPASVQVEGEIPFVDGRLTDPVGHAVANGHALLPWLAFAGLSVWLGLVFIALALWLSSLATQRGTVLGLSLALWLVLVILFDVGLIGLLVATGGNLPATLVHGLFFLNPTSLFRFLNLVFLLDQKSLAEMGFAVHALSPWSQMMALAVWGAIPLCLGVRQLRRLA